MSQWVVQRFLPAVDGWADILNPDHRDPGEDLSVWIAGNAGQAFHDAVIGNPHEQLAAVVYRVLPFEDGATFTTTLSVDATSHRPRDGEEPRWADPEF